MAKERRKKARARARALQLSRRVEDRHLLLNVKAIPPSLLDRPAVALAESLSSRSGPPSPASGGAPDAGAPASPPAAAAPSPPAAAMGRLPPAVLDRIGVSPATSRAVAAADDAALSLVQQARRRRGGGSTLAALSGQFSGGADSAQALFSPLAGGTTRPATQAGQIAALADAKRAGVLSAADLRDALLRVDPPLPLPHVPSFAPDSPRYAVYPDLPSTLNPPLGARPVDLLSDDAWEAMWAAARDAGVLDARRPLTAMLAELPEGTLRAASHAADPGESKAAAARDKASGAAALYADPGDDVLAAAVSLLAAGAAKRDLRSDPGRRVGVPGPDGEDAAAARAMAKAALPPPRQLRRRLAKRRARLAAEQAALPRGVLHPEFARRMWLEGRHTRTIRLVGGAPLAGLPEATFGPRLTSLQSIWITRCGLRTLPESLCSLPSLTELSVQQNSLRRLPANIGQLTSLTALDASGNHVRVLPPSIVRCARLHRLVLAGNRLSGSSKSFPPEFPSLGRLEHLDISRNVLRSIPRAVALLPRLTRLNASHNLIGAAGPSSLPPELWRCERLVELHLSSNRLARLPDDIGRLPRLRSLWLSHNTRLARLPTGMVPLRGQLVELRLTGCRMRQPPPEVCLQGADACLAWIKRNLDDGVDRRKRRIVTDVQALLAEAAADEVVPPCLLATRVPVSCKPTGRHALSSQRGADDSSSEEEDGLDGAGGQPSSGGGKAARAGAGGRAGGEASGVGQRAARKGGEERDSSRSEDEAEEDDGGGDPAADAAAVEAQAGAAAAEAAAQVGQHLRKSRGHKLVECVLPHFALRPGVLFDVVVPAVNAFRVRRWERATGRRWDRRRVGRVSLASEAASVGLAGDSDGLSDGGMADSDDEGGALFDGSASRSQDEDEGEDEAGSVGSGSSADSTGSDSSIDVADLTSDSDGGSLDSGVSSGLEDGGLFLWEPREVMAALAEDHDGFGAAGRVVPGVLFRQALPQSAEDPRSPPVWQALLQQGGLVPMGVRLAERGREDARLEAEADAAGITFEELLQLRAEQGLLGPDQDGDVTSSQLAAGPGAAGARALSMALPLARGAGAGAVAAGRLDGVAVESVSVTPFSSARPGGASGSVAATARGAGSVVASARAGVAGASMSEELVTGRSGQGGAGGAGVAGAAAAPVGAEPGGASAIAAGAAGESKLAALAAGLTERRWREEAARATEGSSEAEAAGLGLSLGVGVGAVSPALCIRTRLYPRAEWTTAMQRRKQAIEAVATARTARTAALATTLQDGGARVARVVGAVASRRQEAANVAASRIALLRRRAEEAAEMDAERFRLLRSREAAVTRLKRRRARLRLNAKLAQEEADRSKAADLPDWRGKRDRARRARAEVRMVSRELRGGRWEQAALRRLHHDFQVTRDATAVTDFRCREKLQRAAAALLAVCPGLEEEGMRDGASPDGRAARLWRDPLPPFASEDSESLWVWRARLRREAEAWGSLLGKATHSLPPEVLEVRGLRQAAMDKAGAAAVAETHRSYRLLRKTAASWRALGIKALLQQWRDWSIAHKQERQARRIQRRLERRREREEREAAEHLKALELAKWTQKWDDFNEVWYWEHAETGETRKRIPEGLVFLDRRPGAGGAAADAAGIATGDGDESESSGADSGKVKVGPKGGKVPTPPWVARGVELARMDAYRDTLTSEWQGVTLANEHAKRLGL
ncbi:hypothetical protein FNF31_04999 [Cafeteria roenbergensis]|uniref:Uncharacterized protein n=1 Tax=Cafeteria roenbergensis TaxID=33653 RepID=A0A5A8D2W9_CAFRO|nr:hypothetical protein FNF31_04999 [Cafeteria roenbergensis]